MDLILALKLFFVPDIQDLFFVTIIINPENKLLPRSLYVNFVSTKSRERMYRIFIPITQSIIVFRENYFYNSSPRTPSPIFDTLLQGIFQHRYLSNEGNDISSVEIATNEMENLAYLTVPQVPQSALKSKNFDARLPSSFKSA